MEKHNLGVGAELLSVLRQEHSAYYQFKKSNEEGCCLAGVSPPHFLFQVILGRCRPGEEARARPDKRRPIKPNWNRLHRETAPKPGPQVHNRTNHDRGIIGQTFAAAPSERPENIARAQHRFNELFTNTQSHR